MRPTNFADDFHQRICSRKLQRCVKMVSPFPPIRDLDVLQGLSSLPHGNEVNWKESFLRKYTPHSLRQEMGLFPLYDKLMKWLVAENPSHTFYRILPSTNCTSWELDGGTAEYSAIVLPCYGVHKLCHAVCWTALLHNFVLPSTFYHSLISLKSSLEHGLSHEVHDGVHRRCQILPPPKAAFF